MKKNIILVIVLCLVIIGGIVTALKLVKNDKEDTRENSQENVHEDVQASDNSQKDNKRTSYYYVSDYDKEQSDKIYEELSDEERELQDRTSYSVGYKKLTDEQLQALKAAKEEGKKDGAGRFLFKEMLAIGETTLDERLTVDDIDYIRKIAKEAKDWYEVKDGLEAKQKYPDYTGGSGHQREEYWLDGDENGNVLYININTSTVQRRSLCLANKDGSSEVLIDFGDLEDGTKKTQDDKENERGGEILETDLVKCDTIKSAVVVAFLNEDARAEMIAVKSGSFDITTADSLSIPNMKNLEAEIKSLGEALTPPKTEGMTKYHVTWSVTEDGKIQQVNVEVQP